MLLHSTVQFFCVAYSDMDYSSHNPCFYEVQCVIVCTLDPSLVSMPFMLFLIPFPSTINKMFSMSPVFVLFQQRFWLKFYSQHTSGYILRWLSQRFVHVQGSLTTTLNFSAQFLPLLWLAWVDQKYCLYLYFL